ncbi:hypothetical protein ZHAS_00006278 [Anopheles sinensis]|uniref:Uncharacterized protein n=1 Tax=Anopheles sinensis TaxID=74873 RepID=A0A084VLV9_ANOSI|nr:hypothetical protein ZHAS_00006278 [Anopheles sinensis]
MDMRVNTVRVDLSGVGFKPCQYQQQEFVARFLEVSPADLLRMQWSRKERCLFLKMRDAATAEHLVGVHSGRHRFPDGTVHPRVRLSIEDGTTDVVVHDLSELVSDLEVQAALSTYGVVVAISVVRWAGDTPYAGIPNGVLLVRMVIRQHIPRYITIGGEETKITYDGQPKPESSLLSGVFYSVERCLATIRDCFNVRG